MVNFRCADFTTVNLQYYSSDLVLLRLLVLYDGFLHLPIECPSEREHCSG